MTQSPDRRREREAVVWVALVLAGIVALALARGVNITMRNWHGVRHCEFTRADGFLCKPLPPLRPLQSLPAE